MIFTWSGHEVSLGRIRCRAGPPSTCRNPLNTGFGGWTVTVERPNWMYGPEQVEDVAERPLVIDQLDELRSLLEDGHEVHPPCRIGVRAVDVLAPEDPVDRSRQPLDLGPFEDAREDEVAVPVEGVALARCRRAQFRSG